MYFGYEGGGESGVRDEVLRCVYVSGGGGWGL